jgi:hypothetical protein
MLPHPRRWLRSAARRRRGYRPILETLESRVLPTNFAVMTNADSGAGSLRQAILNSNTQGGSNSITFQIPGSGLHIIQPRSALPFLTTPVSIDGSTQSGFSGAPVIQLDGLNAGSFTSGLVVLAGNCTIKDLDITHFGADGIDLETNGANAIQSNYIGIDPTGKFAKANTNYGVAIFNGSSANQLIGNLISGNGPTGFAGVGIFGPGSNQNVLTGNLIGTDFTGTKAVGNGGGGMFIESGAQGTRIGSNGDGINDAAERNIISGNNSAGAAGIYVAGSGTNQTVIAGNYVGTDVTGTKALGNGGVGVFIDAGAQATRIGVSAADVDPNGERNVIAANAYQGVAVSATGTNQTVVAGNDIGTDVTGAKALGNGNNGIWILGGAQSSRVGVNSSDTNAAAEANVISGNTFNGAVISDPGTNQNVVAGNLIGTDLTGTLAIPNLNDGLNIVNGAQSNLVGSNGDGVGDALERNIISGNNVPGFAGIFISDPGTSQNVIAGDYVGTDISGAKALPNGGVGIFVANGAQLNRIGVSAAGVDAAGERNVISANPYQGVLLTGSGTNQNVVTGNFIGTDVSGTKPMGNGNNGMWIQAGAQANRVGTNGTDANALAEGNLIGFNTFNGVTISDPGTNQNMVAGNFIGTDPTGTVSMANGNSGVDIANGAQGNIIGGGVALANRIAFNKWAGVTVTDAGSTGNTMRFNSIHDNAFPGIDLGLDGVTMNNAGNVDSGPNGLQNYPLLQSASTGATTTVSGTLNSRAGQTFSLDFYTSTTPNITFFGDGQSYLGSTTVSTDANGNASFTASLPATTASQWITATATDASGNTSEFSAARQLPAASFPTLSPTSWTAIGPAPITDNLFNGPVDSGRVSVAAADPNNPGTMYLGADGGGVWKTNNWLSPSPTWTPLTDNQPSLAFSNIAYQALIVAPTNPTTIYAAISGPGGGILKSTNGGATWTQLGATEFANAAFGTIVADPSNANNLYVTVWYGAVHGGGVYKTTDGGVTWTNLTSSFHPGAASDIVMDPTSSSVLYAGLVQDPNNGATNGIYVTTNGGATWSLDSNGLIPASQIGVSIRLAIAPSAHQTLYATVFDLGLGNLPDGMPHRYSTNNGGALWSSLPALPGPDEPRYWHVVLSVYPTYPGVVFVNGDHELYYSVNGGKAWQAIYSEDPVGAYFDLTGALVLVGDRGIYRATQTVGFQNRQGNLQDAELYTLTLDPNNPQVAYGIAQDQIYGMKFNGVPTWNYLGGGDEVGKVLVDPNNSSRLYEYDPNNATSFVYLSNDGGATWSADGSGIPTTLVGYTLAYTSQKAFVMDPNNVDRMLLATNQVYETTNDGTSWTAISPVLSPSGQFITQVAIASSQGNTIYAATADGHVWLSTNNGSSWAESDGGLPFDGFDCVVGLQVDPANANHVYAVEGGPEGGGGDNRVFVTTNGGLSWQNITGNLPFTFYARTIAVDWRHSTPVLYVGAANGVYSSTNNGVGWAHFQTGLPNADVTDLELLPQKDILAAATYGRGVFEIQVAGPATQLVLAAPSTTVSGAMFSITVTAEDALGIQTVAYRDTVHFSSTDSTASLPADYTFVRNDNGVHTFVNNLILRQVGTQTITVTDKSSPSVKGQAVVTVTAAAAAVGELVPDAVDGVFTDSAWVGELLVDGHHGLHRTGV